MYVSHHLDSLQRLMQGIIQGSIIEVIGGIHTYTCYVCSQSTHTWGGRANAVVRRTPYTAQYFGDVFKGLVLGMGLCSVSCV